MKIVAVAAIAIIVVAAVAVYAVTKDDSKDDPFYLTDIEGVEATEDNVVNGTYVLQRNLILAVPTSQSGDTSVAVQDLINYVLSAEGQAIVVENDYIAINSDASAYTSSIDDSKSYTITIQGSTTVNPIMMEVETAYEALHSNVNINITANGSGTGAAAAMSGNADIAMLSRDLKSSEAEQITATSIGKDGIAIIINSSVSGVSSLTLEQVASIYNGTITNWSQLGGDNKDIDLCGRESSSGTRGAFEEILAGKVSGFSSSSVSSSMNEFSSNNALLSHIENTDYSIGYVSLGIALKALE